MEEDQAASAPSHFFQYPLTNSNLAPQKVERVPDDGRTISAFCCLGIGREQNARLVLSIPKRMTDQHPRRSRFSAAPSAPDAESVDLPAAKRGSVVNSVGKTLGHLQRDL